MAIIKYRVAGIPTKEMFKRFPEIQGIKRFKKLAKMPRGALCTDHYVDSTMLIYLDDNGFIYNADGTEDIYKNKSNYEILLLSRITKDTIVNVDELYARYYNYRFQICEKNAVIEIVKDSIDQIIGIFEITSKMSDGQNGLLVYINTIKKDIKHYMQCYFDRHGIEVSPFDSEYIGRETNCIMLSIYEYIKNRHINDNVIKNDEQYQDAVKDIMESFRKRWYSERIQ